MDIKEEDIDDLLSLAEPFLSQIEPELKDGGLSQFDILRGFQFDDQLSIYQNGN